MFATLIAASATDRGYGYISGECKMAPNGNFANGEPRLAGLTGLARQRAPGADKNAGENHANQSKNCDSGAPYQQIKDALV